MENVPPSYDFATTRDPWRIVAPYVKSTELCALSRVNRELNHCFAPFLWGNPASHFGTENDRVYVALTRFKRTLKRVRLSVRQLTHTLHLPPAQSEIYDGPRAEWLREVLEQLPNLQSLIVSRLPFFDHSALLALRTTSTITDSLTKQPPCRTFPLRLLIAARCQNTTSAGLVEAFRHFSILAYLDLSFTPAAKDRGVLAKMKDLPLLEVLKLRKVHLRDEDVAYLVNAIGTHVRSLDLSGNHLTDISVRMLLTACFNSDEQDDATTLGENAIDTITGDWPTGLMRPDPATLDEFRDEAYDRTLVNRLTSQVISRLPYEDLPPSGITHLSIADNNVSVEGFAALIRSQRLCVLDAGSPDIVRAINRPRSDSHSSRRAEHRDLDLPGAEKLLPILDRCANKMTFLRLDHAIVTENGPSQEEELPLTAVELPIENPRSELEAITPETPELDGAPPLYELDTEEAAPRYELPGDSMQVVVSPAIGLKPELSPEESLPEPRRGSVFAPEVVETEEDIDGSVVLSADGLASTAQTMNGISSPVFSPLGQSSIDSASPSRGDPDLSIAVIRKQRRDLRRSQTDQPHGLVPAMLPNLRSILLTEVPSFDNSRKTVDALVKFIKYCASEAELATLEARLEPSLGRQSSTMSYRTRQRQSVQEIFGLQRIVLEMAQTEPSDLKMTHLSPQQRRVPKFQNRTKSSTEDADSETLWRASEHDFTFFDDEEECGLPAAETSSLTPETSFFMSEKIVTTPGGDGSEPSLEKPATSGSQRQKKKALPHPVIIDTVRELSKFRRERKVAYENAAPSGVRFIDGYWPGEVKVIRGPTLSGISSQGTMDYYGNYHENGIYR